MTLNDYELLYYCYQNNELSFEILANKYKAYIYNVINLYKKKYYFFSYEDIDLYNEGLILLYECVFNYQEEYQNKFSTYFIYCLRFHYLKILRTLCNNKNRMHAIAGPIETYNYDANYYNQSHLLVNEQVINDYLVDDVIKDLPKSFNSSEIKTIYLYCQGYTYKEIGLKLKINTKKIDNTLQKYKKINTKK